MHLNANNRVRIFTAANIDTCWSTTVFVASVGAGNLKARFENMAKASDEENKKKAEEERARRLAREKREQEEARRKQQVHTCI